MQPHSQYIRHRTEQTLSAPPFARLAIDLSVAGRPFKVAVYGTSMFPFIRNGDVITITPFRSRIRRGRVIAFLRRDGRLIIHRVVKVLPDGVITKGDNLPETDTPLSFERIIGTVNTVHRNDRRIRFGVAGISGMLVAWLSLCDWLLPLRRLRRRLIR